MIAVQALHGWRGGGALEGKIALARHSRGIRFGLVWQPVWKPEEPTYPRFCQIPAGYGHRRSGKNQIVQMQREAEGLLEIRPDPSRRFFSRGMLTASLGLSKQETLMQHETYIKESKVGVVPKILAVLAVVAVFGAASAYVVFFSGMWNPPPAVSRY